MPDKEATGYHLNLLRQILAACNPRVPRRRLAVRIPARSGVRAAERCGRAVLGPDGLSDLTLDSLIRGRVQVTTLPHHPKLAAAIKRYEARHRPAAGGRAATILVNARAHAYTRFGIDSIMDRLTERAGFRVHAHGLRHKFATRATKLGWNFEHLRAAMGHADYAMLQRYVRLASERDLGQLKHWAESSSRSRHGRPLQNESSPLRCCCCPMSVQELAASLPPWWPWRTALRSWRDGRRPRSEGIPVPRAPCWRPRAWHRRPVAVRAEPADRAGGRTVNLRLVVLAGAATEPSHRSPCAHSEGSAR